MNAAKRKRLEEAGFQVGSVTEFLHLTPEENELVEIKVALSATLKRRRQQERLSQEQVATQIGSSQSRIAKMEAADSGVSLDLLVRALLATGMTREEVADAMAGPPQPCAVPSGEISLSLSEDNTQYRFPARQQRSTLEASYPQNGPFLRIQAA